MNRLQQLRYDAGLSVEALAELSGVKARTIRELESGRVRTPRVETVAPLAAVLGARASELVPSNEEAA